MTPQKVRILLHHKDNFYFLERLIISKGDIRVSAFENEKEAKEFIAENKKHQDFAEIYTRKIQENIVKGVDLSSYSSADPYISQCGKLKSLKKYKKVAFEDIIIVVDNEILKAKSDEDINFDIFTTNYNK